MKEVKHLSLRIDEITLKKFRFVCDYEARSANNQLLYFVRKAITEYEKEHGEIIIDENIEDI